MQATCGDLPWEFCTSEEIWKARTGGDGVRSDSRGTLTMAGPDKWDRSGRSFALGIEALERFVRGEPLRGVHECVFGVLAFESEPVDPRL